MMKKIARFIMVLVFVMAAFAGGYAMAEGNRENAETDIGVKSSYKVTTTDNPQEELIEVPMTGYYTQNGDFVGWFGGMDSRFHQANGEVDGIIGWYDEINHNFQFCYDDSDSESEEHEIVVWYYDEQTNRFESWED